MNNTWELPADPSAARAARTLVTELLDGLPLTEECVDDAVLVASELSANAIRHGVPPVTLRVDARADILRISVHDHGSTGVPEVNSDAELGGSGRGLAIVTALSQDQGWTQEVDGLTVWADIPVRAIPTL